VNTTVQITREHHDKKLRIEFADGEIAEVNVLVVSDCTEHEDCRGVTYDVISTNRPDRVKNGAARWADSKDIKNFEILGDAS
jgi:hypothetical protein